MTRYWMVWLVVLALPAIAHETDDPLLTHWQLHQLEWRAAPGSDPLVAEGDLWRGRDLQKFRLAFDLEYGDEHLEELELQALYSQAFAPYWDWHLGVRLDVEPYPQREWLALGVAGLAPYFLETEATLFIGEGGTVAARLKLEYDLLLTQRWILAPEVQLDFYSEDDAAARRGSGLAEFSSGLRLRYEIRPELAPYIGVQRHQVFGKTAEYARMHGEDVRQTQAVLGVHWWW